MSRAALVLAVLCALWIPGAAHAASHAALGDSYAAGASGSDPSTVLPGTCLRSSTSWALDVFAGARAAGAADELRFVACPGAVVASIRASQLAAVTADTRLVTLSVGGNDAGFGPVADDCLRRPGCREPGRAARTAADEGLAGLRARLAALYRDVLARMAPDGRLVVTGYPRLFSTALGAADLCAVGDGGWVLGADAAWMNRRTDEANAAIAAAAADAGAVLAPTDPGFAGHRLCDPAPWIAEDLHPGPAGQGAYTRAVCATRVLGIDPADCRR